MASQNNLTTLVCLFHHQEQAEAAFHDLLQAGFSESSISMIGGSEAADENYEKTELASLEMPDKDYDHLKAGLRDGGYVIAVSAAEDRVDHVEEIFGAHRAEKIDEAERTHPEALVAPAAAAAGSAIPIIEEEMVVGKRTVDQGGVRVYRRVVEIPVEESINLQEEHVRVERVAVDRAATDKDLAFGERTIELTETAEEAVVGKSARVVEEVVVGKESTQHTETIHDTVRRTEVDVEEVLPGDLETSARRV